MWKSVKGGLPKKSGYYLVCHKENLPFTAGFNMWGNQNFTVIGGGESAIINDITDWMIIPTNSQKKESAKLEAQPEEKASPNISSDAILAAGYEWAKGNPNAFGINGFQAGVEWAQKQHTC